MKRFIIHNITLKYVVYLDKCWKILMSTHTICFPKNNKETHTLPRAMDRERVLCLLSLRTKFGNVLLETWNKIYKARFFLLVDLRDFFFQI